MRHNLAGAVVVQANSDVVRCVDSKAPWAAQRVPLVVNLAGAVGDRCPTPAVVTGVARVVGACGRAKEY